MWAAPKFETRGHETDRQRIPNAAIRVRCRIIPKRCMIGKIMAHVTLLETTGTGSKSAVTDLRQAVIFSLFLPGKILESIATSELVDNRVRPA